MAQNQTLGYLLDTAAQVNPKLVDDLSRMILELSVIAPPHLRGDVIDYIRSLTPQQLQEALAPLMVSVSAKLDGS